MKTFLILSLICFTPCLASEKLDYERAFRFEQNQRDILERKEREAEAIAKAPKGDTTMGAVYLLLFAGVVVMTAVNRMK
jgi:hypothetical protein